MSKKVLVPIADGTEEIEAAGIIDTLRRADADVTVASVGAAEITASRGVKWVADTTLAACASAMRAALCGMRSCKRRTKQSLSACAASTASAPSSGRDLRLPPPSFPRSALHKGRTSFVLCS